MTVPPDSEATQVLHRSRVASESCEVIATRRLGAYQHLTLVAPAVAEAAAPGQLVALTVGDEGCVAPLRRLLLVHRATPTGAYGGTVEVVLDLEDPATDWLARRRPHDHVDVVGPLGRRFPLPAEPVACVLVADGAAGGAMLWLSELLRSRGCRVYMVLGGRGEDRLLGLVEARRGCDRTVVTTLDGSIGRRCEPADVLPQLLEGGETGVVYAAGSLGLVRDTAAAADRFGVVSLVAITDPATTEGGAGLGCGIGVCTTCAVPVADPDGATHLVRACTEGPVLRGDRVRWEALGLEPRAEPALSDPPGSSRGH
ncbi:dihydroorotate dehydrogenase electron transfer subunit [Intrasporangium calvum]|uniref:Dihydroorotate dehydrogenase electron transfer subunit n=1 Tax=Intrasporangium calvum TaxID=53358 RepID=A0ABT5GCI2_9MICO|nr:dihydroorotate dehydrogenase electron transfer subunit [Intrasporangium calvum]MDC5695923.1 dihydroorotate dehydrogenase electron transfer subunit [Intrasporangium calvum]